MKLKFQRCRLGNYLHGLVSLKCERKLRERKDRKINLGKSLAIQWLGLELSLLTALGSIPGWGIKILQA